MVELATKSANGTIQDDVDRDSIQTEVKALNEEISRIAKSTNFNGIQLLDGTLGGYNGSITTPGGGVATDGITVSGGKLGVGDTVAVTVDADTSVTVSGLGGATLPTGVTFTASGAPEANGTYTFTASIDKSQATAEDYEKYNGLSVTVKMGNTPADGTATFTVAADAAGNIGGGLKLQVGTTNDDFNSVTVNVDDLSAEGLGIDTLDVSSQAGAGAAIDTINDAINKVSTNRGNLGALQNRLEYAINNLDTTAENMDAANSRIRDTDMAKEMMNYTKMNILSQAAQAMLAQANQQPQNILQLLQ